MYVQYLTYLILFFICSFGFDILWQLLLLKIARKVYILNVQFCAISTLPPPPNFPTRTKINVLLIIPYLPMRNINPHPDNQHTPPHICKIPPPNNTWRILVSSHKYLKIICPDNNLVEAIMASYPNWQIHLRNMIIFSLYTHSQSTQWVTLYSRYLKTTKGLKYAKMVL